uniref:Uncharacterized protein n=2 Tax=Timema TaxID=61471 RepID=A0A7R8VWR0_TIMDO|nr:unnamed protein product [Timema douglasi]
MTIARDRPIGLYRTWNLQGEPSSSTRGRENACIAQLLQINSDGFGSGSHKLTARKYVPAASYAILKKNPDKEIKINLKELGDFCLVKEHNSKVIKPTSINRQLLPKTVRRNNSLVVVGVTSGSSSPISASGSLECDRSGELCESKLGIAIGNGLCDPAHMMLYGDHLYQLGLIDVNAREHFYQVEHLIRQRISEQDWESAMEVT